MCAWRALSAASLVLATHRSAGFPLWLMSAFHAANGAPFAALALQDASGADSALQRSWEEVFFRLSITLSTMSPKSPGAAELTAMICVATGSAAPYEPRKSSR